MAGMRPISPRKRAYSSATVVFPVPAQSTSIRASRRHTSVINAGPHMHLARAWHQARALSLSILFTSTPFTDQDCLLPIDKQHDRRRMEWWDGKHNTSNQASKRTGKMAACSLCTQLASQGLGLVFGYDLRLMCLCL